MLNLTDAAVTLVATDGKTTTIEPSGYVARVEYELRVVGGHLGLSCSPWRAADAYPDHRGDAE